MSNNKSTFALCLGNRVGLFHVAEVNLYDRD